jgi:hypothetical protein
MNNAISSSTLIQPQQSYIYVNNSPAIVQSTACVPQTGNIIIQAPSQLQAMPSIQLIQTPRTTQAQYIQITSSTPQMVHTIPTQSNMQMIQGSIFSSI